MSEIDQIREIIGSIRPRAFHQRIDYWRVGDMSGGESEAERVTRSFGHPMPAWDSLDMRLNQAEADYRLAIDGFVNAMSSGDHRRALGWLRKAEVLERIWLVPISVLDAERLKELDGMVSDAATCLCSGTKELWERGRHRTPWRIKAGFGPCCYSSWSAAGRPEKAQWLKTNRPLEVAS